MDWLAGYWALAALATGVSALLTLQAWEHRRFARSRMDHPNRCGPPGHILLVVACKGADSDLETNLRPLFEQSHDDYEVVFSVEADDDPACPVIGRLIAQYPNLRARLVVAGISTKSGQKIHNLLAATRDLPAGIDTLAFVDADVRPPRTWLFMLTQRLWDHDAATGYRWFVPKRPTLANWLLSSIDSAVVSLMFPGMHHTVWGGSWTIRREAFDAIGLRDAWYGTLSDDLVASRVLAKTRQRVSLEPSCVLPSPLDVDMRAMFAFVCRQLKIGRLYAPALWRYTLLTNCAGQLAMWGSLALAGWGIYWRDWWALQPAGVFGLLYVLGVFRAWLRQQASRHYLPHRQTELAETRRFDTWCGPIVGLAWCLGLLGSAFGQRIVWKGIVYEMGPRGQVRSISRSEKPSAIAKAEPPRTQRRSAA